VIFGASQRLSQVNKTQGVHVAGAHVQFTGDIKLLGAMFNSTLFFKQQARRWCHSLLSLPHSYAV